MKCGVVWCVFIILHFTSHFSKNNPTYCVTVTFIIVPVSSELFIHVQPLLHVSHNSDREILFRVLIPTCQLTIGEWLGGVSLAPQPPLYHWRCVVSCNVLLLLLLHCSPTTCQGRPGHQSKVKLARLFCGGWR